MIDSFDNITPKSLERVLELHKKINKVSNELKIFKGNLCNKEFLKEVFQFTKNANKKIDGVIHFAGLKSVSKSVINPLKYWSSNILGTINLLSIMEEFNCNNIVFSSSATIYDRKDNFLLKENSEVRPINPYGNTKLLSN